MNVIEWLIGIATWGFVLYMAILMVECLASLLAKVGKAAWRKITSNGSKKFREVDLDSE